MKRFLLKISLYLLGIILLFCVLGTFADGNTDDNYRHFAVPKPQNIILGDSRGSQAVIPDVLQAKLSGAFDNFSLNVVESPYGKIYLEALKRKLDPETKNGVFILTVDPWNLSLNKNVKSEKEYPEEHSPLKNMHFYNWSPNYEYLLKNYSRSWFKIYLEREETGKSNTYLHKNGWLEVNVDMNKDSVAVREKNKIEFYNKLAAENNLSAERILAFKQMINYLKPKGKVFIVRIPASKSITEIENKKYPDFSKLMNEIANKNSIKFFDFSTSYDKYLYTDGNHMYKESGKIFSSQIADSIRANQ
ncbi:hypothetical protein JI747_006575 [Chryseobacterium sp. RG1]|uniref:Uncharacterized protein n=1 Tax=Chryseobacterium tagetis TaxID=2801334 RepID=A0ABS7ZYN2_9FLAO|nr:hypothetical protein [Chryseobacterium tagetis]MCA6066834.1 hypothetical protein [Chryseobacterium tagetis]